MRVVRAGQPNPNALDVLEEINPFERATRSLKRLNYLLGFIKDREPEVLTDYVSSLISRFQDPVEEEKLTNGTINYVEILCDLSHLEANVNLAKSFLNLFLHTLGISEEALWEKGRVKVANGDFLRSFLLPAYYDLQVLVETLGREKAISLYKRFITHYLLDTRDSERPRYDSLETLFEEITSPGKVPSDWVVVSALIADGKFAYRNDNCLWVEALADLEDSELKYYVCCYGDYEGARNHHESIVLTMEHTIAQGDPYCSRVLHDTRVDWDLRHPPTEFWDSFSHPEET